LLPACKAIRQYSVNLAARGGRFLGQSETRDSIAPKARKSSKESLMNKKAVALAVAGALGGLTMPAAALAQTSTVQIGGSLTVFYYHADANNASTARTADILETSEPEIFVRGEEKLGGDLSAWFQCTSSVDGIVTGAATAFGWCGRNSGVGFKGGWGNVWAGNWDVPHKLVFNRVRGAFGGTNPLTGGSATILAGGSASGLGNAVPASAVGGTVVTTIGGQGSFFRRQASSWHYHSPVWAGFQLQGAFSAANEQASSNPEISPLKQRMWSVAAHYDNGPLYLGAAYERHNDYNPAAVGAIQTGQAACAGALATGCYAGGNDNSWIVAAGYTFAGKVKVTAGYQRNKYETLPGVDLTTKGWMAFVDWNVAGPHTVRAGVAKLSDTSGTSAVSVGAYTGPARGLLCGQTSNTSCASDTGAIWWNIHYEYAFSKRTAVLLAYNKMDNDNNARFSLGKVAPTIGASQDHFGLGIKHRF
jgi:predicted porin